MTKELNTIVKWVEGGALSSAKDSSFNQALRSMEALHSNKCILNISLNLSAYRLSLNLNTFQDI